MGVPSFWFTCAARKSQPGGRPAAQTRASPPHQAKTGLMGTPASGPTRPNAHRSQIFRRGDGVNLQLKPVTAET